MLYNTNVNSNLLEYLDYFDYALCHSGMQSVIHVTRPQLYKSYSQYFHDMLTVTQLYTNMHHH
jgi:hypothetical protein